ALAGTGLASAEERLAADEVDALVEADGEAEPGLEGRLVRRDVARQDPVALLDPERVDRAVPAGDEPVRPTRLPQRVPEGQAVFGRRVELPTELADVRDPERDRRDAPDGDLARSQVREPVV